MTKKSVGLHARMDAGQFIATIIAGRIQEGVRIGGRNLGDWIEERGKEKLAEQVEAVAKEAASEILKFYKVTPKKYE